MHWIFPLFLAIFWVSIRLIAGWSSLINRMSGCAAANGSLPSITLRKVLGDDRAGSRYVANNPGRGYAFGRTGDARATDLPNGASEGNDLPAPLMRIVGRDDVIVTLAAQLARRRFLTIVGPGGIGKTTVAVAVAGAARASHKDGVWFVGLASLSEPELVPTALAHVRRL
jgi:hypothetical protein